MEIDIDQRAIMLALSICLCSITPPNPVWRDSYQFEPVSFWYN